MFGHKHVKHLGETQYEPLHATPIDQIEVVFVNGTLIVEKLASDF